MCLGMVVLLGVWEVGWMGLWWWSGLLVLSGWCSLVLGGDGAHRTPYIIRLWGVVLRLNMRLGRSSNGRCWTYVVVALPRCYLLRGSLWMRGSMLLRRSLLLPIRLTRIAIPLRLLILILGRMRRLCRMRRQRRRLRVPVLLHLRLRTRTRSTLFIRLRWFRRRYRSSRGLRRPW